MNIQKATERYEAWMERNLATPPGLDRDAIAFKHMLMKDGGSAFPFLRATFYRWAQRWQTERGILPGVPRVLSVGDLHIENFGTWCDASGRLIWGINDLDEACELPWTSDLVRLGVSASLAIKADGFRVKLGELAGLILSGYEEGMKEPAGAPFDLSASHHRLRRIVTKAFKSEAKFWAGYDGANSKWQPIAKPPTGARRALESALPHGAHVEGFRVQKGPYEAGIREPSGLGSLGRHRYCVLARDASGRIVREAKVLLPSAAAWAAKDEATAIKIGALLQHARRLPDPYFRLRGQWTVRRIAPDAVKINLKKLKQDGFEREDQMELLRAMGRETANIHLGSEQAAEVLADLERRQKRDRNWFGNAIKVWRKKVETDWKDL
jgi:Uncharacterized protein conserved in bacteria (DUF2252)